MASSRRNSSTLVPPLGTPFNTITCFSDQMVYPPNAPQRSRQIHQRGRSSPRSPSSIIQSGRTVLPVPGPSIVPVDNDPNWENALTNPSINNNITNRLTSSTRSWSKPYRSDNTNEQLAEVLGRLLTPLMLIRLLDLILIQGELKSISLTLSAALSLTSSTISCSNAAYTSVLTWRNSTQTLWKSTLQWPTLLE